MTFEMVEVFLHRGRLCVIVKNSMGYDNQVSHNGYVSVRKTNEGIEYEKLYSRIKADEPTYAGYLETYLGNKELYFIGFDSNHAWNDTVTKTQESVKGRTKLMADEMISGGI